MMFYKIKFLLLQKSISATGAYGRNWFDFFGRLPAVALCATGLMYVNELAPLDFRNDAQEDFKITLRKIKFLEIVMLSLRVLLHCRPS